MQDYTEYEIKYLSDRIREIPIPVLVGLFCKRFYRYPDLQQRSPGAVRQKIYKMIKAENVASCLEDFFSITEVAELLGIENHQVRGWVYRHGLPVKKMSKLRTSIKRKDLKDFAIARPYLFREVERSRLEWLLEDADLADSIKNAPAIKRKGKSRQVVRIRDGKVFSTASEAAAAAFIDRSNLTKKIDRGLPCSGSFWKFLD